MAIQLLAFDKYKIVAGFNRLFEFLKTNAF